MQDYFKEAKFRYPWRKYQQRVLNELSEHLADNRLHVVAPPGSGKTILGLEVAVRLNKPCLILAPALAIRNQWVDRFCELFLQTDVVPDWISNDIRNPSFMTVITYQGLHAACAGIKSTEEEPENDEEDCEDSIENKKETKFRSDEVSKIVKGLIEKGIETIVVDEAHHLKNEWWNTLTALLSAVNARLVCLTATPPYDVSPAEWQKYTSLCGPVDAEISVPELVSEGDLCPHQDYVHFSMPSLDEAVALKKFKDNARELFNDLRSDTLLKKEIFNHKIWRKTEENYDWIYSNIECYSASLIFLNSIGETISKEHLKIVGEEAIPEFDYFWMERLLGFYLFGDDESFTNEEHKKTIIGKLRRNGVIDNKQISFSYNRRLASLLSSSVSKLDSIIDITSFEYNALGDKLRMVILADFIHKQFLNNVNLKDNEINKTGVIPIFEKLRRKEFQGLRIVVLSGSIVIIPASLIPAFESVATEYSIFETNFCELTNDSSYVLVQLSEQVRKSVVQIITAMFERGRFEVLIGTKSLLGEGWDAPSVNTLVLASFVGSFVLSNQMRGRAIRTQKNNPGKTGNIWHLVCVDPDDPGSGHDFSTMQRRFSSFVGVSVNEDKVIETGFGRLGFDHQMKSSFAVENANKRSFRLAGDRFALKKKWDDAIPAGHVLTNEIKIPYNGKKNYAEAKSLYLRETVAYLIAALSSGFVFYLDNFFRVFNLTGIQIDTIMKYLTLLGVIAVGGVLFFGIRAIRALRYFLKYRDIAKDIGSIGEALTDALVIADVIHTEREKLKVMTQQMKDGTSLCYLDGGTGYEKSVFISALSEIVSPLANPRYLIIRKSRLWKKINQSDYHAVPEVLGRNKNIAEYFAGRWSMYAGNCELVYTRNPQGRQILLQARMKSLSSRFSKKPEFVNKWV